HAGCGWQPGASSQAAGHHADAAVRPTSQVRARVRVRQRTEGPCEPHDFGANAPENWEHPIGTPDVHVALALYARDDESLQEVLELARKAHHDLADISVVY